MENWEGKRCKVCGLKTLGTDLCNKCYEAEEVEVDIDGLEATEGTAGYTDNQ